MKHRAFKQDVRDRQARTGEKYTTALRAIEEILATPAAEVYRSGGSEPYYSVEPYDHEPYGPYGNTLVYVDETDETYDGLASADGDGIDWVTFAGKTRIAVAILQHRFGEAPTQDLIDLFLVEIASTWQDGFQPTVFVGQLRAALGI